MGSPSSIVAFTYFPSFMTLQRTLSLLSATAAVHTAWCQTYVGFDGAVASSTYAPGDFAADKAISSGSDYWCRCNWTRQFCLTQWDDGCVQFGVPHGWSNCYLDRQDAQQAFHLGRSNKLVPKTIGSATFMQQVLDVAQGICTWRVQTADQPGRWKLRRGSLLAET